MARTPSRPIDFVLIGESMYGELVKAVEDADNIAKQFNPFAISARS